MRAIEIADQKNNLAVKHYGKDINLDKKKLDN